MNWQHAITWLAPIMGFVTILIGVFAIVSPQKASKTFGLEAQAPALPWVIATGARDIFIGLIVLILWWSEMYHLLGLATLSIAVVAITDFTVTRKSGNRRESYIHLVGAIAVIVYGTLLLLI